VLNHRDVARQIGEWLAERSYVLGAEPVHFTDRFDIRRGLTKTHEVAVLAVTARAARKARPTSTYPRLAAAGLQKVTALAAEA
jgi:hypothetical protein